MRHNARFRNVIVAILGLGLTGPMCWAADDTATTVSAAVASIRLSGRVVDQANQPVIHATVTLVASDGNDRRLFATLDPQWACIHTETDRQGRYQLHFSRDDTRFLIPGKHLLVVRAAGYRLASRELPMARLQVDVPIDVRLRHTRNVTVEVVNSDGQPSADVSVYLAVIDGQRIPWSVARRFAKATTDRHGRAELDCSSLDSLGAVFLVGRQIGQQRAPVVRSSGGILRAATMPVRDVHGKIVASDKTPISGMDEVAMFVITCPQYKYSFARPAIACTWAISHVAPSGQFKMNALGIGQLTYRISCPARFPYREPYSDKVVLIERGTTPYTWQLGFRKQVRLKATTTAADTGKPLPNIHIACSDGRLESTFTDRDGQAEFYRRFHSVSYYPSDALGEYFSGDAFYLDTKKLPHNDQIEMDPVALVRSSVWRGRVVDQQGRAVAGAKVKYEYAQERFTRTGTAFSDSEGEFRLRDVADGTAVKLHAAKDNAISDEVSCVVDPKKELVVKLTVQPTAKPVGRVVDLSGRPMAGIAVSIKKGETFVKESYRREELSATDLYDEPTTVRTHDDGRFEFPATIDRAARLQIQIDDPRCFPFYSPFVQGTVNENAGGSGVDSLELGDSRVMRRPMKRSVMIRVVSREEKPIANAAVVIVGARTGTARGTTSAAGQLQLDVHEGRSIIAIKAPGYRPLFARTPALDTALRFVLQASHSLDRGLDEASIRQVDRKDFMDAAKAVFAAVHVPDPKSSTYYRLRLYLETLATVTPGKAIEFAATNFSQSPQVQQAALMCGLKALERKPELIETVDVVSKLPDQYRNWALTAAARATGDVDLQQDWLAEALVAARNMSGTQKTYSIVNLAKLFLISGHEQLAEQLISELWSNAADLRAMVKSGRRDEKVGESRTLGPMLAIVDLDRARKLIALTAREVEAARLKSEALLYWGLAHRDEFAKRLRAGTLPPIDPAGIQTLLYLMSNAPHLVRRGLPEPLALAKTIDDPKTRMQFALFHARLASDDQLRHALVELAINAVARAAVNTRDDYYSRHYVGAVLPGLQRLQHVDSEDLDRLVFASLWHLPPRFDNDRLQTVLAGAAQILAFRDRQLARVLLEPCYQDCGWLFMVMGSQLGFANDMTLESVAGVDPKWSIEIVDHLCGTVFQRDAVSQLELRTAVIRALVAWFDRL